MPVGDLRFWFGRLWRLTIGGFGLGVGYAGNIGVVVVIVAYVVEHDIVRYLDKKFAGQALVHDGDRHLDHVRCDDDFEIWFDITDAYNNLGESFGNNS